MAPSRDVEAFVRRLEHRIGEDVGAHRRIALAYSGGLASTLIAAIVRKRTALECVVAGVEGSPDFQAARTAKAYLDYRVEYAVLSPRDATRILGKIAARNPKLPRGDVENLVPLHAALERAKGRTLVSGFGSPRLSAAMIAELRGAGVSAPLHAVARGASLSRGLLREAAISLGLPAEWARAPHRSPAEGAGIQNFSRTSDRSGE